MPLGPLQVRVFRGTTDTLGNLAIGAGVGLAIADKGKAGAIVAGAGILTKLIAASVTPNADTRAWDTLPQYLTFAALQLPAGEQTVGVDFKDATGVAQPALWWVLSVIISCGTVAGALIPEFTKVFVSTTSRHVREVTNC